MNRLLIHHDNMKGFNLHISYKKANRIIRSLIICIIASTLASCNKEISDNTKERFLTHEDSLALGLIVQPDTTKTKPEPPTEAMIEGINYMLYKDGFTAEVTSKQDYHYTGDISIPETIFYNNVNYSVVAIKMGAFSTDTIKSVTIPSSVVTIGDGAFWLSRVEKVQFKGEGLKKIENMAFANCNRLEEIIIPNSVTEIGWRAFHNCGITSLSLSNGLREIKKEAFRACPYLKKVKLSNKLEIIGDYAFYNCSIESITLPESVKDIGNGALYCTELKTIWCYAKAVPNIHYDSLPFSTITLYVPRESIDLYRNNYPWKNAGSIRAIEDSSLY